VAPVRRQTSRVAVPFVVARPKAAGRLLLEELGNGPPLMCYKKSPTLSNWPPSPHRDPRPDDIGAACRAVARDPDDLIGPRGPHFGQLLTNYFSDQQPC